MVIMKKPISHSTFYIYDNKIYIRMKAIAQIQGKSVTEFIWDELTKRIEQEYGKNTLSPFLGESIDRVVPPLITDSIKEQKIRFMHMNKSELIEYEKDLLKHVKILKNEMRGKKNE